MQEFTYCWVLMGLVALALEMIITPRAIAKLRSIYPLSLDTIKLLRQLELLHAGIRHRTVNKSLLFLVKWLIAWPLYVLLFVSLHMSIKSAKLRAEIEEHEKRSSSGFRPPYE